MAEFDVGAAVEAALSEVPDTAQSRPGREVARLLAAKLAGECSPNEAAALARELRQTLRALSGGAQGVDDPWESLTGGLGGVQ